MVGGPGVLALQQKMPTMLILQTIPQQFLFYFMFKSYSHFTESKENMFMIHYWALLVHKCRFYKFYGKKKKKEDTIGNMGTNNHFCILIKTFWRLYVLIMVINCIEVFKITYNWTIIALLCNIPVVENKFIII